MKKTTKDAGKASPYGTKMGAKGKAAWKEPKVEKAGAPKNLSKKGAGIATGKMPKGGEATCYGGKGTK